MAQTLPILDLSQLDAGHAARTGFQSALLAATHDIGFFYLTGHGIPEEEMTQVFAQARAFFALPMADKLAVEMLRSPHFRGYTRNGGERTRGQVDWREQIDVGSEYSPSTGPGEPDYMRLEGPNLWPAALPQFRPTVETWMQRCASLSMRLMRAWAVALGSPEDVFDAAFGERPSQLLKLVRYPGRADRGQGVGPHNDPGVLTLLLIEPGKGGLQVQHGDGWIEAPSIPGAFVVNIGELLEFATNGYLKATRHRVISPADGDERLSVPFFFNPALNSTVPVITLPPELARNASGVTQDPDNIISGTFGDNVLKARLRAHPDVAARHHADLVSARAKPDPVAPPQ